MDTIRTILTIIFVLVSIVMTALILMQEGKGSGLSGGIAGAAGDSYVSRNQSRTKEGKMKRYTTILVAAFMVLALLLNVLQ